MLEIVLMYRDLARPVYEEMVAVTESKWLDVATLLCDR